MSSPTAPDRRVRGTEPDARAVADALAPLGREHRDVLICTFYQHLPVNAAAARLGIPPPP